MLKLGNQRISAAYLGGIKIKKAYLGEEVVFDVPEPPVPTYTITAAIDPAGSGTVSGAGTYPAGETVTITAAPGDGYKFTGWQENGAVVSEDAAYSFTVTGDRTLTAVFGVKKSCRLPEGYIEVEYIYTSSSANVCSAGPYVQIPAIGTAYKFEIIFSVGVKPTEQGNSTYFIFGKMYKSGNYVYRLGPCLSGNAVKVYTGTSFVSLATSYLQDTKYKISCNRNTNFSILEGNTGAQTTGLNALFTTACNLFTGNWDSNTTNYPLATRSMKIYESFWYDSSNLLVRDIVPCIDPDGKVGFYDIIQKVFLPSAIRSTSNNYTLLTGPEVK